MHRALAGRPVLAGVDLVVPAGATVALMGPSGAGKTTLVRHLLGLQVPESGEVLLAGRPVKAMSDSELRRALRDVAAVVQGPGDGLMGSSSVRDNVLYVLEHTTGLSPRDRRREAQHWLRVLGLEGRAGALAQELSRGERKRAALARALAPGKPVLVLDDLEGGLDPVRTALVCDVVADHLREGRRTCLLTTHSTEVAQRLADRVAVLSGGRIAHEGPVGEVLALAAAPAPASVLAPVGPPPVAATPTGRPRLVLLLLVLLVVLALIAQQLLDQLGSGHRVLAPF